MVEETVKRRIALQFILDEVTEQGLSLCEVLSLQMLIDESNDHNMNMLNAIFKTDPLLGFAIEDSLVSADPEFCYSLFTDVFKIAEELLYY